MCSPTAASSRPAARSWRWNWKRTATNGSRTASRRSTRRDARPTVPGARPMSALLDAFVSAFDALPVRESAGLGATRRAALDAALRDGLPGPRTEAWKYTPLRALERRAFVAADAAPA